MLRAERKLTPPSSSTMARETRRGCLPLCSLQRRSQPAPSDQNHIKTLNCVNCMSMSQEHFNIFLPASLPFHLCVKAVENILDQSSNQPEFLKKHHHHLLQQRPAVKSMFRRPVLDMKDYPSRATESQFDSGVWSESVASSEPLTEETDKAEQLLTK